MQSAADFLDHTRHFQPFPGFSLVFIHALIEGALGERKIASKLCGGCVIGFILSRWLWLHYSETILL